MPLISVVIPTYNRCEALQTALKSVYNQTYTNIEVQIISDGSTDHTSEFLHSIHRSNVHFVILPTNRGGNEARNEGIKRAKGEYIAFLDDDDYWVSTKLEEQLTGIIKNKVDLCYTGFDLYSRSHKYLKYVFHRPRYANLYKSIMDDNFMGGTSSIIVKKRLIEKAGYFDPLLPSLQDYDLYIRLIKNGCSVIGINKPLVRYYILDEKSNVSCSSQFYKSAAHHLFRKYRDEEFFNLLKRRIRIIAFKKMLKSKQFRYNYIRSLLYKE